MTKRRQRGGGGRKHKVDNRIRDLAPSRARPERTAVGDLLPAPIECRCSLLGGEFVPHQITTVQQSEMHERWKTYKATLLSDRDLRRGQRLPSQTFEDLEEERRAIQHFLDQNENLCNRDPIPRVSLEDNNRDAVGGAPIGNCKHTHGQANPRPLVDHYPELQPGQTTVGMLGKQISSGIYSEHPSSSNAFSMVLPSTDITDMVDSESNQNTVIERRDTQDRRRSILLEIETRLEEDERLERRRNNGMILILICDKVCFNRIS